MQMAVKQESITFQGINIYILKKTEKQLISLQDAWCLQIPRTLFLKDVIL